MQKDYIWALEQEMLIIYMTLVHRVNGIGLSLNDFWEMDTWTISLLYLTELDLIEHEEEEANGKKTEKVYREENNPEVENIYTEMFEDESNDN